MKYFLFQTEVSANKFSRNIHILIASRLGSSTRSRGVLRMRHANAKNRLDGYRSRGKPIEPIGSELRDSLVLVGQSCARAFTKS